MDVEEARISFPKKYCTFYKNISYIIHSIDVTRVQDRCINRPKIATSCIIIFTLLKAKFFEHSSIISFLETGKIPICLHNATNVFYFLKKQIVFKHQSVSREETAHYKQPYEESKHPQHQLFQETQRDSQFVSYRRVNS